MLSLTHAIAGPVVGYTLAEQGADALCINDDDFEHAWVLAGDFCRALARPCDRLACHAWLAMGGLAYTAAVVSFALDRIRYFHAAWQIFVLAGSIAH